MSIASFFKSLFGSPKPLQVAPINLNIQVKGEQRTAQPKGSAKVNARLARQAIVPHGSSKSPWLDEAVPKITKRGQYLVDIPKHLDIERSADNLRARLHTRFGAGSYKTRVMKLENGGAVVRVTIR